MPPRATWKGHIKLSLISFPVRLYTAVQSGHRIGLNQLHSTCKQRIKTQTVCPQHGPVDRSDLVKGYEFEKGKYVIIEESDLAKIKLESDKTIELVQFIPASELDPLLLDSPYYIAPDGAIAADAFTVIREAMRQTGRVAIGRVVMNGREHIIALTVQDRGFVMTTLRYADEVRRAAPYFEDIKNGEVNAEQLQLARQLVEQNTKPFNPAEFSDRYYESLMAIIRAKIEGSEPVLVQETEVGKVINLMDALKQSVEMSKKPPAKSVKTAAPRKKTSKKQA